MGTEQKGKTMKKRGQPIHANQQASSKNQIKTREREVSEGGVSGDRERWHELECLKKAHPEERGGRRNGGKKRRDHRKIQKKSKANLPTTQSRIQKKGGKKEKDPSKTSWALVQQDCRRLLYKCRAEQRSVAPNEGEDMGERCFSSFCFKNDQPLETHHGG